MTEMVKVNVGCGEFYAEGWINIDRTQEEGGPQPDIVASAESLPLQNSCVDRIYAGHVLEHVELIEVPKILAEFERVLKNDGVLVVVGPDLTRAEYDYPDLIPDIKYGGARWEGDTHLWESRESTMYRILKDEGWETKIYPIESPALDDWPVTSTAPWQFAIAATKFKLPSESEPEPEAASNPLEGVIIE